MSNMSSRIIHQDQAAFQPHSWQLVHRSGDAPSSPPDGREFSPAESSDSGNRRVSLDPRVPDKSEAEIREALTLEFQARLEQERSAAYAAGRDAAQNLAKQEMQAFHERLARSIEELGAVKLRYRQETEREVVQLSIEIARRILRRELTVDPEAILGLLRTGLESISIREVLEVRIHPSHADAVRLALQTMGAPGAISIVGDSHLEPGAVTVETRRGGFDASAETQLEEIQRGFADLMQRSAAR